MGINGVILNTKVISLTIVFAALAIALTPIAIPAGYIGFFYRFWEIPIVAAFLLFGPEVGVTVAVLRTLAELTLFPGPIPGVLGFLGALAALGGTLSMLLGLHLAGWLLKRRASQDENSGIKPGTYYTALGGLLRMLIVPFVMYPVWRFLSLSDAVIIGFVPPLMLFAFTLCLYTIPIGYLIATMVNKALAVGKRL